MKIDTWLKIMKALLLLSFCFLIGKNEDFSFFVILAVILELANFYLPALWAIIGIFFLLFSIGLDDNIARRITFFIGCAGLLIYLIPYFTDADQLISYTPSVVTFSIFFLLLIATFIVKIISLQKADAV